MAETCRTCRWYDPLGPNSLSVSGGFCRWRPPPLLREPITVIYEERIVSPDSEWCSEHRFVANSDPSQVRQP